MKEDNLKKQEINSNKKLEENDDFGEFFSVNQEDYFQEFNQIKQDNISFTESKKSFFKKN